MAKKQTPVAAIAAATLESVAELSAMIPKPVDPAEFVKRFRAGVDAEGDQQFFWVEMSQLAVQTFGQFAFARDFYDVETVKGDVRHEPHEDCQALRTHLESAYGMPDAPERSDKSDKAQATREKRKSISTMLSVYIGRMSKYITMQAPESAALTLEAWAKRNIPTLYGKPAVFKDGKQTKAAVKPKVPAAPAELIAMLFKMADMEVPASIAGGNVVRLPVIVPAVQAKAA